MLLKQYDTRVWSLRQNSYNDLLGDEARKMAEWTLDFPIKTDFLNASDIKMAKNPVIRGISEREQNGTLNSGIGSVIH